MIGGWRKDSMMMTWRVRKAQCRKILKNSLACFQERLIPNHVASSLVILKMSIYERLYYIKKKFLYHVKICSQVLLRRYSSKIWCVFHCLVLGLVENSISSRFRLVSFGRICLRQFRTGTTITENPYTCMSVCSGKIMATWRYLKELYGEAGGGGCFRRRRACW